LVAGTAEGRSQKVHNLLVGLERIDAQSTVLAFVDSDAQVHSQWLKSLVRPLANQALGATSGFRWYMPCCGSIASSLRSAWNAATLGLIVHPRFAFAWGGSSAIRRQTFEHLWIREAWARGLSDDLLLTQAVRDAGLGIGFIPACLVPTFEPCTWRQLVEWTNRQVTIARIYAPHLWRVGLLMQLLNCAFGVLAIIALVAGHWLASGGFLSYWVCSGLGSMLVCRAAGYRLAAHGYSPGQRAWVQALWFPMVTALSLVSLAVSLTTRTITWRGISYTMLSPSQVVVHHRAPLSAMSSPPF
jgi:cellulose synthase/poly-beta-1,6-N-acetylglucosamine synthase-like glycosyltransferase